MNPVRPLRWDAAPQSTGVDAEAMELAAPLSGVADACRAVSRLGALEVFGGSFEALVAVIRVARPGVDEGIGGGADLTDGDFGVFPPGAAGLARLRRDG